MFAGHTETPASLVRQALDSVRLDALLVDTTIPASVGGDNDQFRRQRSGSDSSRGSSETDSEGEAFPAIAGETRDEQEQIVAPPSQAEVDALVASVGGVIARCQ